MVSSTVLDLPVHREEVKNACLQLGMFPVMMEHLPASDSEAVAGSRRMVDEADIYLGIFLRTATAMCPRIRTFP